MGSFATKVFFWNMCELIPCGSHEMNHGCDPNVIDQVVRRSIELVGRAGDVYCMFIGACNGV